MEEKPSSETGGMIVGTGVQNSIKKYGSLSGAKRKEFGQEENLGECRQLLLTNETSYLGLTRILRVR